MSFLVRTNRIIVALDKNDNVLGAIGCMRYGALDFVNLFYVGNSVRGTDFPSFSPGGVGTALMKFARASMRSNWFTLSTTDNRALGAYLRQGLKPVDVYFELQAYKTSLNLEFSEVEAISTSDAEVEQIKAEGKLFGLDRADVYSHWRNEGDAEFFQLMSRGRLIGFGTILYNNNIDIWSQSSLSIGPVIVREATLLVDSLIALARVVKSEDALIRIMIPGNSSVANKLIHLGFKVEGHEILMTSDCVVPSNADAYVPSNFIFF